MNDSPNFFEEQFDTFFYKHTKIYPNGTCYLKCLYLKEIERTLNSVWSRYQHFAQRSEAFWENLEEVIADILWVTDMSFEQLFQTKLTTLDEDDNDFEVIKEKLYEHPLYPMTEHLNYIDFPPALQRGRFILKHLEQFQEERLRFLDLGFGPGVLLSLILQAKAIWIGYGVDISNSCYRYTQKLLERKGLANRCFLQVADVRKLPYSDKFFDLIIAVEVLEHISAPRTALSEALRVLKQGGFAIIALPVRLPIRMHLSVFAEVQDVLNLYQEFGLKILDFEQHEFQAGQSVFTDTFALLQKPTERR